MNVRRMEAETIRDAMLALSGQISLRLGGKPVPVMEDEVGQFVIGKENLDGERKPGKAVDLQGAQHRRSLYVQVRRTRKLSFLDAFDAPAMEPNCAKRPVSTVAPQALIFMNNAFVISQSRAMAERLQAAAKDDLDAQLTTGWHHAFGRAARPSSFPSRASLSIVKPPSSNSAKTRPLNSPPWPTTAGADEREQVCLCRITPSYFPAAAISSRKTRWDWRRGVGVAVAARGPAGQTGEAGSEAAAHTLLPKQPHHARAPRR